MIVDTATMQQAVSFKQHQDPLSLGTPRYMFRATPVLQAKAFCFFLFLRRASPD